MSSATGKGRAAVLASHGDRGGAEPNATLRALANAVRNLCDLTTIEIGVLKGAPSLEDAMRTAAAASPQDILIYPLFMADGYFTGRVLPERIAASGHLERSYILPPLGLDPELPGLLLADALNAATGAGFSPHATRLLVVGHGSKIGPASAEASRRAAHAIAAQKRFSSVETAFLEEPPFLADALDASRSATIVAGFFFGDGLHAGEDVPEAIRESGATAVYSGAVGSSPHIAALIAAAFERAMKHGP